MYTSKIEYISPEKAAVYLKHNKQNRKVWQKTVDLYAGDMESGNWTTCTEPIDFDEHGVLLEGQHRLLAIIQSGCGQSFTVNRNVPRSDSVNNGQGRPRSIVDSAKLSGLDPELTSAHVAIASAIALGRRSSPNKKVGVTESLARVEKYREAIDWILKFGPKHKAFRNAIVRGALCRAWYYEKDKARLERFCKVLNDGMIGVDQAEVTIIKWRDILLDKEGQYATNETLWRDFFLKTQNAVWNYMRHQKITVFKPIGEDRYPLKY